eukprot:UN17641
MMEMYLRFNKPQDALNLWNDMVQLESIRPSRVGIGCALIACT